jgi:hypothetical protein
MRWAGQVARMVEETGVLFSLQDMNKICIIMINFGIKDLKSRHFGKITGPFSPTVPPYATRSAGVDGDVEASGDESGNV